MTAEIDVYGLIEQISLRPSGPEAWPLYFWEDEEGNSEEYCWPCAERFGDWLDRFVSMGWMTPDKRDEWKCGRDDGETDTSCPECHHCGRPLMWSASEYCIESELDHWESCTDGELISANSDDLETITWGLQWLEDEALKTRLLACITRFLSLTEPSIAVG